MRFLLYAGCLVLLIACGDGKLLAAVSAYNGGPDTSGDSATATPEASTDSGSGSDDDASTDSNSDTVDSDSSSDSNTDMPVVTIVREAELFDDRVDLLGHAWYLVSDTEEPGVTPDGDESHADGASGGAYLEVLPDLVIIDSDTGQEFVANPTNAPQLMYDVVIPQAGRYFVWVRGYTTGGKDNSIHVGLDGEWPDSGLNMQFPSNLQTWAWSSNQRYSDSTVEGLPNTIYLDITAAGAHQLVFAMREDGFELDQWILTNDDGFMPE